ncbi:MAG: hypothetical protein UX80_C0003G0082 [Candidatus Amesbacteria bacterium GW2011_GWA2_47_11b]|uniref:Transcriptional regulator n=3 Tax=Candidatus Amesiibacteriota TaxID=1752730 RepID=A0A0G1RMT4_9BACT|nr:MAG: hypothetical protein UX80_C0003G0082 [Candidatus Amesbacteria bacterium GW2011_GWA2_47_11b]
MKARPRRLSDSMSLGSCFNMERFILTASFQFPVRAASMACLANSVGCIGKSIGDGTIKSMSGHSKWATIHRQKGINDAKKGAIFTKLGKAITIAVKQGKGLQLALEKAKQYNMPKDNIERALHPAQGELYEVTFEGFGPGGVAVIVSAVTDNKLRTAAAMWELLKKGTVAYLFSADKTPNFEVRVEDVATRAKIEAVLEKLENLDDVQKVWTNYA